MSEIMVVTEKVTDNGEETSSSLTRHMDQFAMYMYSIEGLLVMIFNIFMFTRIMTVRDLRQQKEFVIMAACMLFDIIFGLTYFAAGTWRTYIFFNFNSKSLFYQWKAILVIPSYSQWMCYWTPSVQLFIITTPGAGYLLVLTALDRFACIFFPLKYIKLPVSYSYIIMFMPYALDIPTCIIAFFDSFFASPDRNKYMICMMYEGISKTLYMHMRVIRISCSLLVVLIYIPVAVKMYYIIRRHTAQMGLSAQGQKKLLRLTATTAMITLNTIIFFTVPDIITFMYPEIKTSIFYIMNMNKGVVNIVALLITQKPLRRLYYRPGNKIAQSTMERRTSVMATTGQAKKKVSAPPP